tara:strand:- start:352 stop:903 length:552 start_codon:yes stop_codon:yes gene_type:complete
MVFPIISFIDSESFSRVGLSSRYIMISLVAITSVVLFSELNIKYYNIIVLPIIFILCVLSIFYYTSNLENHIKKIETNLNELDVFLYELSNSHENITFYTVESLYPMLSSKLYAINKNVSSRSKNYAERIKLDNFIYISLHDLKNQELDIDNPYYIHSTNLGNNYSIIKEFKDIKINISKKKK